MNNGSGKSQPEYRTPPFAGSRYENIGERVRRPVFEPLKIEVVHEAVERSSDPMFADYGGRVSATRQPPKEKLVQNQGPSQQAAPHHPPTHPPEELQRMLEEQFQRGVLEGEQRAHEQIADHTAGLQQRFELLCGELSDQMQGDVERIERQALGLAILISRRIIAEAVEINPEYLLPVIRDALGYVGGADVQRVRISPADLEFVEIEKIRDRFDGNWSFIADPAIVSGCIIDTSAGEVDYRLDAAWERLKDQVIRSTTA